MTFKPFSAQPVCYKDVSFWLQPGTTVIDSESQDDPTANVDAVEIDGAQWTLAVK